MTEIATNAAILLASLAALVKGADWFLQAAERVGMQLGLSPFIIGVTLLGAGTSLPELVSGIVSVLVGDSQIAVGTAVGSNVTNILLILSAAALIGGGLVVSYELVRVDLPFLFGSALMLALFAMDGQVDRLDGGICLVTIGVYLAYTVSTQEDPATTVAAAATETAPLLPPPGALTWIALAGGLGLLQVGAYFTVASVVDLAALLGVASSVLAASLVAIGTSLPELSVSVRSAQAGRPELAVGNVIGSNIFNALGVVGGAALFGSVIVAPPILRFAIPVMLGSTVLCFFVLQEREMTRWDGWLLLLLFVAFTLELYRV
jgi:cation:H+ antiporter